MAKVDWYYKPERRLNQVIIRDSSVDRETSRTAHLIAALGQARLAPHKANNADDPRPGSWIDVTEGDVDAFVNLNDPDGGAVPISLFLDIFGPFAYPNKGG